MIDLKDSSPDLFKLMGLDAATSNNKYEEFTTVLSKKDIEEAHVLAKMMRYAKGRHNG